MDMVLILNFLSFIQQIIFNKPDNKLKRRIWCIIGILILSMDICFGQSSVWKVSNGEGKIYIGGTIHLLREQDFPLPKPFETAYDASSILVFETDISQLESPGFQQKLLAQSFFPGDSTIENILSEDILIEVKEICAEAGIPFSKMKKLRPAMLILTLVSIQYQKLGISSPGVDVHYYKRGLEESKKVLTLESAEEQINFIVNMAQGHEEEFVKHSLEDLKNVEKDLTKLIDIWRAGRIEENVEEIEKMKEDYPSLYETILVDRNHDWLPQIELLFNTEDIEFVLVGNLHLHGSEGLLEQLRNKGFVVDQIE